MNYRTTMISQCLLGVFLATASHVPAADKPPENKGAALSNVAAPDANAAWQRRLPELFSDNLPLGEIIDLLRKKFPEINFVIKRQTDTDGYVSGASVAMVLRSVTLPEILKAIELASDRPIQITGGPGEPENRLVIFERKFFDPSLPQDAPVVTRIYNVSKYLASRSDKEAAAALKEIEDVVRMAGRMTVETSKGARSFDPNLSIHPGTKLLIAVGRPDELMVIEQVIKELHNTPVAARVPKGEAAHAHDEKH